MFGRKSPEAHNHEKIAKLHAKIHRSRNFFPGQRDSEEVKLCIRTHWIQRLGIFMVFFLFAAILPGGIFYLLSLINFPEKAWLLIKLITIFYFLLAWLLIFIEFIKSDFSLVVVTNERIVDIYQTSLFNHQISETNLDRIQEIGGFTEGIWRNLLDVGRLEIQTAGRDVLVMRFVKSPQLTARKILDVQQESQRRRRGSDFGKRESDQGRSRKGESYTQEELKQMRKTGPTEPLQQRKPNEPL